MLRRKLATALLLAIAASLMLASGAFAKDRNHDRIPDKWEKRHHLSLKHKQGRRDQDHDGLKNRGEFRAKLNPRKADTDGDGVDDGDENTGTVESFQDGVLTLSLFNGDTIKGAVTDDTEIECDDDADDDRGRHHHGDDNDEGNEDCGAEALVAGAKVLEAELKIRGGEAVWDEVELFTP